VPTNLLEWCYTRFGKGLTEKYLAPYNEKIWKRDLREMSLHWVERVPSPPMEDILKSAIGIETEGYTFQLNFHYPEHGGYESVIRGLAANVPDVVTGFRARSVRRKGAQWEVSDGSRTFTGDRLVSTIPVFDLMNCLKNVPDTVTQAVAALQYNPMLVVMIAVKHEGLCDRTAIYLPDPKILAHRVCYMKTFAASNAPAGCSHLIAEITAPPGDLLLSASDSAIIERVVTDLKDICGFTPNDVIATEVQRIPYAYPVYDMNYTKNTETYYAYLDAQEIYFTGRFAAFKYVNSDKCVEMAQSLAMDIRAGVPPRRDWSHL
jgi:protoporphyrinogen oxidase